MVDDTGLCAKCQPECCKNLNKTDWKSTDFKRLNAFDAAYFSVRQALVDGAPRDVV
jgi:hypothetical protein